MKIYNKITDLIGNTPLLELKNYEKNNNGINRSWLVAGFMWN